MSDLIFMKTYFCVHIMGLQASLITVTSMILMLYQYVSKDGLIAKNLTLKENEDRKWRDMMALREANVPGFKIDQDDIKDTFP